jgi:hypothetical protein
MAYPSKFKPLSTPDLIRLGGSHDGGYVLPRRVVEASEGLLSFGLNDDWEFEGAFLKLKPVSLTVFDHTVHAGFWVRRVLANLAVGASRLSLERIRRTTRFIEYSRFFDGKARRHVRKAIGYPGPGAVDLEGALGESGLKQPIFLKMDIEGWEYRILDQLAEQCGRFSGMAIEFHDEDLHRQRIEAFIDTVAPEMALVHFHPNNFGARGPDGDPVVIEMTFASRKLFAPGELAARELPLPGLDAPNDPGSPEKPISFLG